MLLHKGPLSISSMSLSPMKDLVEAIAQTSASMKAAKCSPDDGQPLQSSNNGGTHIARDETSLFVE
ncbi:hypothetical protein LTS08_000173 [Lithohypha guttulata]|uniref:Uncharacterized protein n=2 Tax=Lithohypha guttulata TaxID=1690604 RepID=A0AAN7SYU2_9EURO|nr:hypothetical protein LTR05_005467 [Lithohypha guttulata]KAK5106057.1 hypothetical protein LTS08_000173 [Lithohypha guttulata]